MNPPLILVNATTMNVGGGIQVAVGFVEHAAAMSPVRAEFAFALSTPVYDTMDRALRTDRRMHVFSGGPAHPIHGRSLRRALQRLETRLQPTLVYSVGFPSYVAFRAPEVGQYTNGWEICDFPEAWNRLSVVDKARRSLRSRYRLAWARRARYFETQTETAKAGIVRRLGVDPSRVLVLPNSINPRFIQAGRTVTSSPAPGSRPRVFCISAAYPHKNLTIVPAVAHALQRAGHGPCTFVFTLPESTAIWRQIHEEATQLRVRDWIANRGPLTLDECVDEYRISTCVFMPSLAEIFSATYVEAMAMRVPVVTTALEFGRAICRDAALYYDPLSPTAAADALGQVLSDAAVRERLVMAGERRVAGFSDARTNYGILLDWLIGIASPAAGLGAA